MFDRALLELQNRDRTEPFYGLLQTLSSHTPYALPDPLPIKPVAGHGGLDEHLTAMRYSDWALGRVFAEARKLPDFDQTLYVILGDHGFGTPEQLTDIDLNRFHVPVLLIGPRVQALFGRHNPVVATQVDLVPTIIGRLGRPVQHQCWGRDLLSVAKNDPGFGVIKPSGSDQTVALISGQQVLVQPKGQPAKLYDVKFGKTSFAHLHEPPDPARTEALLQQLSAFLQIATQTLLADQAGATASQ
jgi:phosphoglycerol transferase MdoB-like AlkP superfamily enzyme